MRKRHVGAQRSRAALVVLLPALLAGPAAAERTGTPRIALSRNQDWIYRDGLGATGAAPSDTLFIGSWTFGTGSCSDQSWTSVDLTAGDINFGDFAGLLDGRSQYSTDRCTDNLGCLWGFIAGSTDTYACGGRPSQAVVPYGGAQTGYIWNEIQSPPISLTGSGSTIGLRFSVYRGLPLHDLVFYTWRVRSLHGGVASAWKSRDALYYGATVAMADWFIQDESVGALIEPGADRIQIALGVIDMAGVWAGVVGDGACHSNAPLFDTVKLYRVAGGGPQWSVEPADLFQDNFASDGTTTGTVRMDIARDVNPRETTSIQPGDSLVVSVNEPTVGLGFHQAGVPASGPAVYLHVRDLSPGKDGAAVSGGTGRWPVAATAGGWTTLRFDSVRTQSGTIAGRYCVDLNDELYTPGDVVEFYVSARDAAGRVSYWSEFAGTTVSPPSSAQTGVMEATCLPVPGRDRRAILLVDDADGSGTQIYFDASFQVLGIQSEVDRYDVRCPDGLVGNGPGSRVRNVAAQLADAYDTIIWSSGTGTGGLIGDASGVPEKSPDAQMLLEFLELKVPEGVLYLNGDHLAAELKELHSPAVLQLQQYIQYDLVSASHSPLTGISPKVSSTPTSTFTHNGEPDSFILFGGCPQLNSFAVLAPSGPSVLESTYGLTAYGAEIGQSTPADSWSAKWVLLSGFGFEFMRDDELDGVSDRALHLHDILESRQFPEFCGGLDGDIHPDETGAEISWKSQGGSCARRVRIVRRLDNDPADTVIHEADIPPWFGVVHDVVPPGHRAHYRVDMRLTRGREVMIDSATVFSSAVVAEFRARARDLGIEVSWSIPDRSGIAALTVEKRLRGGGAFAPASDDSLLSAGATRFFDTEFEPGASYEYRLAVRYTGGWTVEGYVVEVDAPGALALGQNVPNPFNPSTRIPFLVPSPGRVEVTIFNVNGARVRTLLNDGRKAAGYAEVQWDGRNDDGSPVSSGVYFCRLSAQGRSVTRKIVMVR